MLAVVIISRDFDIVVKNVIVFKCVKNAFGEDVLHLVILLSTMLKNTLVMYVYITICFNVLEYVLIYFYRNLQVNKLVILFENHSAVYQKKKKQIYRVFPRNLKKLLIYLILCKFGYCIVYYNFVN